MLNYLQSLLLMILPHPWDFNKRIGSGKVRFWFIERYNYAYHQINDDVTYWRKKQIEIHSRMIREQDQSRKIIMDRNKACKNDIDPMSQNYPDSLFYRKR